MRVLLLWPGGLFGGGKNFGVPQLLGIAAVVRQQTGATVDVVDLDLERLFGKPQLGRILAPGYDVIGLSCYSSYDYLKTMAIGARVRELAPSATLLVGGYHPSARPEDFAQGDSPFDHVVIGEGELPMSRVVQARMGGGPMPGPVLGPEPWMELDRLPLYDWSLLERYRPRARQLASQAEIYTSRGCPFGCSFCMERAKKQEAWRPFSPERALEELHRLDAFLDLSRFTLRVTDALFGLRTPWRRAVLEGLARKPLRARRIWLLTRVDLLEREDVELMAAAGVSPGFGIESGSHTMLRAMGKSTDPQGYLDAIRRFSQWALQFDVPFGVNFIVGHPGETESTVRESAQFASELFLGGDRSVGFLSVDPFRLYPGSEIDARLEAWKARTGMRVHRYPWWHDGDPSFLSEWVDGSGELDYLQAHRLRRELFGPILRAIPGRFCHQGPARDYFMRAVDEQVHLLSARNELQVLGLRAMWHGAVYEQPCALDEELAAAARQARIDTLAARGIQASDRVLEALVEVPRERYVDATLVAESSRDRDLLDPESGALQAASLRACAAWLSALESGRAAAAPGGADNAYCAALRARLGL
jgi:anaerobic magnesium-protoporphyrin IX monomethyl ester cyclase